jgi:LysM repeat protein
MNNNQPSSSEPVILDAKQQGRSRVKVAVFSVLAVHVAGLTALLFTQGCKRDAVSDIPHDDAPPLDTNQVYYAETNLPPDLLQGTNSYVAPVTNAYVAPTNNSYVAPISAGTTEYVVKSGDSFYTIAKNHGTTIKALSAANPGVDSRRLKIGQKLVLPSAGTVGGISDTHTPAPTVSGDNFYVVKSGDTLSRIATRNNTTVKEIKSLNGLTTDRINVGQKLKLPPPPVPAPVPVVEPLPSTPPAEFPGTPR